MQTTAIVTPADDRASSSARGASLAPRVICFPFVGDVIGGSHISALGLIQRLDRRRFAPLVVLQDMSGPVARLFRETGIEIEASPTTNRLEHARRVGWRQMLRQLADVGPIMRFLHDRRVEIVHSNDGRVHAAWALPTRLAGAKLLWHHRGHPDARGLRHVAPLLAHRVVTVSHFAAPRHGRLARPGGYEVVYSPFDTNVAEDRPVRRAELLGELGCPPETRLIGYFGSFITRKRPLLFVEAIASLRRAAPDLPVMGVMFGEAEGGAGEQVLALAASSGVEDRIRLMGFRTPGTRWLAACDLLMVTAVDEPFGRTLIEAMLLRTPIVATASGGNVEALRNGETGLLAPADDARALAEASRRLLDDPALHASIAIAARADALSRFSEEMHADAIGRIYDELLGSPASSPG